MTSNANILLSRQLITRKRSLDGIVAILKQTKPEESVNNHHSSALDDDSQTSDNKVFQDNNDDTAVNFFVDDVDDDNILIEESFPRLFDFNINRLVSNFDIIGIVKTYGRKILRNDRCISADDKTCLTNSSTITKGSFARVLNQWCEENKVTKKATLELLTIMHNSFGHVVRLPVTLKLNSDNEVKDDVSTGSQEMLSAPRFNVLLLRTMITQYPVFSPSINALMIVQSTLGTTIEVFNVKFARRFALGLAYE